jgi:nodulation protein E
MRRVVITGAGTVNALARNVPDTMQAMREARCGIGPLTFRDADRLTVRIGAEVGDWVPQQHFTQGEIAIYDRFTQFAVFAAREAMAQSALQLDAETGLRAGVILGSAAGGIGTWEDSYRAVFQEGRNRVSPLVVPRLMHNAAASHLSMIHGLRGPAFTIASACASANHAMGQAMQMIRAGLADVMLTGGAEAMLCFGGIKAWEGLRVLAPDACRPFSADRRGMVMGEGAAVFVFEEESRARARGAPILAEVAGFGMTADAGDLVAPSVEGAARAMALTLADAGLSPEEVGYINAHGTGTAANDRSECAAVKLCFADHAENLLISSTKSMHGHAIGATGAIELLACLMALTDGVVAPTVGYRVPDPDCALDVVANEARHAAVEATLSNAFAFGGLNAVLALRRA